MWNAGGRGIVLLGFEQANCYTVLEGSTVGLFAEDLGGFGKALGI